MFQIQSTIKITLILSISILVIFLLVLNKSFAWTKIEVGDVLWKMESIRSETMNDVNDYCMLYYEFNKSIFDKEGIDISDIENIGLKLFNFLKLKDTKVNTKYLNTSIEKAKINEDENKNFIDNLKEQETKNNYKNCDYLTIYDVWNGDEKDSVVITISIFDIRRNKTTSDYLLKLRNMSFFNPTYPKLEDKFVDKALNKWWKKYQE